MLHVKIGGFDKMKKKGQAGVLGKLGNSKLLRLSLSLN